MAIERKSVAPGAPYSSLALAIHQSRYQIAEQLVRGATVLDLACGEGLGAAQMASLWGAKSVHAVDASKEAIKNARKAFGSVSNLSFEHVLAEEWLSEQKDCYDIIVSIETLEHVNDPAGYLSSLKSVLKENGVVILTVPNDAVYFGPGPSLNPHHKSVFSFDQFKALVTSNFDGPYEWILGGKASGFYAVPSRFLRRGANYSDDVLDDSMKGGGSRMSFVPMNEPNHLNEENALFYGVVVGGREVCPSVGMLMASPFLEQGRPGLWKNAAYAENESVRCAIGGVQGWRKEMWSNLLPLQTDGRIGLKVIAEEGVGEGSILNLRSYDHLHLDSLDSAYRILQGLSASYTRGRLFSRGAKVGLPQTWSLSIDRELDGDEKLVARRWIDFFDILVVEDRKQSVKVKQLLNIPQKQIRIDAKMVRCEFEEGSVVRALLELVAHARRNSGVGKNKLRVLLLSSGLDRGWSSIGAVKLSLVQWLRRVRIIRGMKAVRWRR